MRSKKIELSEILSKGLVNISPDANVPGFSFLKNLKTNGTHLVGCKIEKPYKVSSDVKPFMLLNKVFAIQGSSIVWLSGGEFNSIETVYTDSQNRLAEVRSILAFHKFAIIQTESTTFFFDGSQVSLANPSGRDIPLCKSLADLKGQLICFGLSQNSAQLVGGVPDLDSSYVCWSGIGSDNFELTKSNTAGFFNPLIGEGLLVIPFQKSAILLGTQGSTQMLQAGSTFGFKDLNLPRPRLEGIYQTVLSASSGLKAAYIDQQDHIIILEESGKVTDLDFSWIAKDVVDIRYLKSRDWFIFTTASNSYVLDDKGMFSFDYIVYGEAYDQLIVEDEFEQASWEFETTCFNLNKAGLKNSRELFIADNLSNTLAFAKIFNKEKQDQGFKVLNSLRATKYPLSGQSFGIAYTATNEPTVSTIQLEYIDLDKRFGSGYIPYKGA